MHCAGATFASPAIKAAYSRELQNPRCRTQTGTSHSLLANASAPSPSDPMEHATCLSVPAQSAHHGRTHPTSAPVPTHAGIVPCVRTLTLVQTDHAYTIPTDFQTHCHAAPWRRAARRAVRTDAKSKWLDTRGPPLASVAPRVFTGWSRRLRLARDHPKTANRGNRVGCSRDRCNDLLLHLHVALAKQAG